jgi:hypothetical protein
VGEVKDGVQGLMWKKEISCVVRLWRPVVLRKTRRTWLQEALDHLGGVGYWQSFGQLPLDLSKIILPV